MSAENAQPSTAGLRGRIRAIARNTHWGICARLFVFNQIAKLRLLAGDIATDSGSTHAKLDVDASIAYIQRVFREFREQAGVPHFHGRIAEIGPGDNCGVGLLFLDDGCAHVDLVDRFYSRRDMARQAKIYRALPLASPQLRTQAQDAADEAVFTGVTRHYGASASADAFFAANRGYDFIVSRTVLQLVQHPVRALLHMMDALNPGGMLLHLVDLRDLGQFSATRKMPLEFLEVPQFLYREMTSAVSAANRVPLSAYRRAFEGRNFDVTIKVTSLVGGPRLEKPLAYADIPQEMRDRALAIVREARPRLAAPFRGETDEDLSVSGFFLTARKAASAG